ncbi:TSC22 domain family protein 2-like isoform X2 [Girardinichthys multiradiatus]|uniref:TSC22 domain family protein 2-like isoform X2 n=1 Tax=Girardinichthys multiradiatus TaxID=208333 RepID=UPI001FAD57B5|nr:TSC22 domain family protein 2-like isoform X2 [Girardinichthys multiradiatus]
MSKMPTKKSCFQITSVTQARPPGTTDDTESLDDPDESRTEEMSTEIYDVSRAEYEPACDRSSSDEALNNVGEAEAQSNAPQATQPPGPGVNTTGELRKVVTPGSVHGGQHQSGISVTTGSPLMTQHGGVQHQPPATASPSVSANTSYSAAGPSSSTSTVSCSSRFRVIKLDHGTGEPFRRGRWTCTEFYEKDSETSHAGRTDSIRHASVTLDPAADRDSGLGPSVGSTVSPATHSGPGLGSMAEGSHSSLSQQVLHQSHSSQQHGSSSSFSSVNPTALPPQSSLGGLQLHGAQNVLPIGQNGLPHSEVHLQKSPMMPPSYPTQQPVPGVHPITSQSSGLVQHQTEYYQQPQPASIPLGHSGGQSLPVSSFSAVTGGHIPAPVMPPVSGASVVSQVGDAGLVVGVSMSAGPPVLAALQQSQTVGFGVPGGPMLVGGSTLLHQTTSQYAPAGQPKPIGHSTPCGVQNVPAITVGSSAPTSVPPAVLSASIATMPNVTTSSLPPGQIAHSKTPGASVELVLPTTGFGQVEASGGRKSEGAVIAQSPVVSGREAAKPFMPETLQLTTPAVTSLFGIHIPVDGEEDSASGTNIVAIDNKIEQAMDLVKSHLMYAVREEVEVLKEQIKELFERNSVLERENAVLKSLANSEQLSQLTAQTGATAATPGSSSTSTLQQLQPVPQQLQPPPQPQPQTQLDASQQPQPNVTSA